MVSSSVYSDLNLTCCLAYSTHAKSSSHHLSK